jgi:hypothetical protein
MRLITASCEVGPRDNVHVNIGNLQKEQLILEFVDRGSYFHNSVFSLPKYQLSIDLMKYIKVEIMKYIKLSCLSSSPCLACTVKLSPAQI